jgi:Protein of unknown function (DUF4089)
MDLEEYMHVQARMIGLPIDPLHQPGVIMYLGIAHGLAQKVMSAQLGNVDEPANVFTPVAPDA